MAKVIKSEKRRKRAIAALAALLSLSMALGAAACAKPAEEPAEEDNTVTATDPQLLKNGNFEYYSEMDEDDRSKKLNLISTPNDWSFSSGSPSSDTKSGIVDAVDWGYMSRSGRALLNKDDAAANWTAENVTAYDRVKFYDENEIDSKDDFALYEDYAYTVDFEDLEYLNEVGDLRLHDHDKQVENGDTSVLMIHNRRTSDGVRGTAQHYTSGTSISLNAGTSAKISVWVKTAKLYHYAASGKDETDVEVTKRAGAYILVTPTVGSTTLGKMAVKNINTREVTANNGWAQYTVYIRANTFASTKFTLELGLGMGTSDNRYEAVDGYAFFDDVTCEVISNAEYLKAVEGTEATVKTENTCSLADVKSEEKDFVAIGEDGHATAYQYALDLYAPFTALEMDGSGVSFGLTEEVSGSRKYTTAGEPIGLGDNRNDADTSRRSVTALLSRGEIENMAATNGYVKTVYDEAFKEYPEGFNENNIVLLLSTNGAAYTAKLNLPAFEVAANTNTLISFFVKTSSIRSGASGAGAAIVDAGNKSAIAAFDSTTVAKVDVNEDLKDIYKGWVQCFFFVSNDTDAPKTFRLELTYGATTIAGTNKNAYCEGYAAFANFETSPLTKDQLNYASAGNYAVKATLTDSVKEESRFDAAAASGPSVEDGLATPSAYTGVLAGSNVLVGSQRDADGEITNANPNRVKLAEDYGIYAGLLNAEYADGYRTGTGAWNDALNTLASEATDGNTWWKTVFGNNGTEANAAYQPLVILNTKDTAQPSYGFLSEKKTFDANSTSRISVRVKLSADATAYVYLTDVSDVSTGGNTRLKPALPKVTYWYDDDGNIVNMDPAGDNFAKDGKVVYRLQSNGLYTEEGKDDGVYYANLSNFETNDRGDLTTPAGTTAYYYYNEKYYAYYDPDAKAGSQYTQEVVNLPASGDFVRYTAPSIVPEARLTVRGSAANADKWVTLTFYIQTGNTAKDYRLEFWAGERTSTGSGIPANGYVFFDRVKSETITNYDALLEETEDALRRKDGLEADDKLGSALYYTFTFYDSAEYLRYDATQDKDKLGNYWASYKQSEQEEAIVWLECADGDGSLLGTGTPEYSCFLNYAAVERTVEADDLGGTTDTDTDTDSSATNNTGANLMLMFASILLAVVLVGVIAIVIGRRVFARVRKNKPAKKKKSKQKQPKTKAPAPEKEAPAPEKKDENDPYNE